MFVLFFFSPKVMVIRHTKSKCAGIKVVLCEYGLNHNFSQKNIKIGKSFFLRAIKKN